MKTNEATIGEIRAAALDLWRAGYQGDRRAQPIDKAKPLIPSVIAARLGLSLPLATLVNHCLVVWSLGTVPVGEFDAL